MIPIVTLRESVLVLLFHIENKMKSSLSSLEQFFEQVNKRVNYRADTMMLFDDTYDFISWDFQKAFERPLQ